MNLRGTAHKYGNDINTDVIIPGKYTKTLNFEDLKLHAMEDIDVNFKKKVKLGDFIVAGENFGIGSSREQAPLALKVSGIKCVVAKSFSRIFYRNAINIGLVLIECNTDRISDGDTLVYEVGKPYLKNQSKRINIEILPLNGNMKKILSEGGLVNYIRKYKKFE